MVPPSCPLGSIFLKVIAHYSVYSSVLKKYFPTIGHKDSSSLRVCHWHTHKEENSKGMVVALDIGLSKEWCRSCTQPGSTAIESTRTQTQWGMYLYVPDHHSTWATHNQSVINFSLTILLGYGWSYFTVQICSLNHNLTPN